MDLTDRSNKLLTGITYKSFTNYPTFSHWKSIFNDGWYNHITPSGVPAKLDWMKIKEVIASEEAEGNTLSYAVRENLLEDYRMAFVQAGHKEFGTEFYMYKTLTDKSEGFQGEFEEVTGENLEKQKEMGRACFPEWPNEDEYCELFLELSKKGGEIVFKNLLYKVNSEYVGFCAVLISKEQNLAYLHNFGVLANYRRRGYFTDMVNYTCNLVLENGATDVYAVVDEDAGSYPGFSKLGFKTEVKYYLFETK